MHGLSLAVRRVAAPVALTLAACSLISSYDPVSHRLATDLKTEALLMLAVATEPASGHAAEIRGLRLRLAQALAYERSKGEDNEDTVRLWESLLDPEGGLVAELLLRWEADGALRANFLREAAEQVGEAFDEIILLERGKARD